MVQFVFGIQEMGGAWWYVIKFLLLVFTYHAADFTFSYSQCYMLTVGRQWIYIFIFSNYYTGYLTLLHIYTGSQDRTVKMFTTAGKLVRTLEGHSHWVNTIVLNTDYALRTGAYDHTGKHYEDPKEAQQKALERYQALKGKGGERLASASDDHTMYPS